MQGPDEPVLSASETALMLHIHPNTLRRWTMEGKINRWPPFIRGRWLYRRTDVDGLFRKQFPDDGRHYHESSPED
jgi:predicted site-specific integrase-resolvase